MSVIDAFCSNLSIFWQARKIWSQRQQTLTDQVTLVQSASARTQHVPAWRIRCNTEPGERNGWSWQDWTTEPTLVVRIRAFSSLRFTPAIKATSLMSSSSLKGAYQRGRWLMVAILVTFASFLDNVCITCKRLSTGKLILFAELNPDEKAPWSMTLLLEIQK